MLDVELRAFEGCVIVVLIKTIARTTGLRFQRDKQPFGFMSVVIDAMMMDVNVVVLLVVVSAVAVDVVAVL